ncbi:deoxynucleoside triphosphate triphosphohydrolase SAMHD1-like isoform X3 [Crassostrea virginica]
MLKRKIINDPIWGPIELHPLCVRVINTPEFQRLRSIKQLGGCSYVYPGACHSRFEHSIGTSYLAGCLSRALQKKINEQGQKQLEISDKEILCLELGGLCHDLGHGPFSHLLDLMFYPKVKEKNKDLPSWTHEDNSLKMIDRIFESIKFDDFITLEDIEFIKELIQKPLDGYKTYKNQPEKQFFFEIIANDLNSIDVDKWDYFSRDCHMLGLHHNFQCERTIKLAKVVEHDGKWHISYPKSEWFNLFDMYYTRFTLHRRAYQHPVAKAVDIMITDALLKADEWLTFPPGAKNGICLSKSVTEMDAYMWVTDDVLHQVRMLPSNVDEDIADAKRILDRIHRRDLYRLVGENKITWRDLPNQEKKKEYRKSLQEWMKPEKLQEWMKQNEIEENHLRLYHTEISAMLPTKFEQIYIRLYWKGEKNEDPNKTILKKFHEMEEDWAVFVPTKRTDN